MREAAEARAVRWLCDVIDLMRSPTTTLPVRPLLALLADSFEHHGRSWNWSEYDGSFGVVVDPPDALVGEPDTMEQWASGEFLDCHALAVWFVRTGDASPFTLSRVPTGLVPRNRRLLVERPLKRLGLEQQLSIPYRLDGAMYFAFVLARSSRDFDDADLEVAGIVQQSLRSLDRQCVALRRLMTTDGSLDRGLDLGLSGRELAVLQLLDEGHSTRMISRRLGCRPRTVEKHLENCFRKLGVRDRLNAVRVARLAGVLGIGVEPETAGRAALGPGEYANRRSLEVRAAR